MKERLQAEEVRALQALVPAVRAAIQSAWTGWRGGTGRSRAAWTVEVEGVSIVARNPLGYVVYVHRTGTRRREWQVLAEKMGPAFAEAIATELGTAFQAAMGKGELREVARGR